MEKYGPEKPPYLDTSHAVLMRTFAVQTKERYDFYYRASFKCVIANKNVLQERQSN